MTSSVIRRYTPPTCTLEIIGQSSPLSRWMKQPVIKNLQFRLHFDDPRRGLTTPVTVKGDRTQLENLCDTVTTYVQSFLAHPPQPIRLGSPDGHVHVGRSPKSGVSLTPGGLTQHLLDLGPLAGDPQERTIPLSAIQLFDLATVLEEYTMDLLAPPELAEATPRVHSSRAAGDQWRYAASVVAGIGITAASVVLLKNYYPSPSLETAEQIGAIAQTAKETAPEAIAPLPPVGLSPPAPTPSPLTSEEKLPPPPPPGAIASVPSAPPEEAIIPPTSPTFSAESDRSSPAAEIPVTEPEGIAEAPEPPVFAEPAADLPAPASPPTHLDTPVEPLDPMLPPTAQSASPPLEDLGAQGRSTLFDHIPQVAEVREYLQQQWTAQENLNQTIEYNLTLNPDGSLQKITPLGETARTYLDRTGLPLRDEPFVSPLASGTPAQLRVVLSPDGTVQTFLQSPH